MSHPWKPLYKESLFSDFDGQIKSLGAWEVIFIMALSETDQKTISNRRFQTIVAYKDMIL
jgi:hypothetical protein